MSQVPEVEEIVVPSDYSPPGGCKYKARALNYAANASSSLHHDWIVHLDEETRFDVDTVENIFAHCVKQEQMVARGESKYPSIGQGVIYYNTATIDNYLTTLADYIRVSDDYAKFQLQYKLFRMPLVGMHGSFVVCQTSLQRDVGWDWGMVGSITEDTYFAMYLAAMGVRIDWCGGKMYEQSPFSCSDFAKQRARWFSGLWLCVLTKTLPLSQRVFLGTHLVSWSLCPIFTFVTWINLLVMFPRTQAFIYLMSFVFAIPFFSYALGFVLGSSPAQFKHGIVEWGLLLVAHVSLIPVYTIMETWGVVRGIVDRSTYTGFHIVQKEKIGAVNTAAATVTELPVNPAGTRTADAGADSVQNVSISGSEPQAIVHAQLHPVIVHAQLHPTRLSMSTSYSSDSGDGSARVRQEQLDYCAHLMNIDFDQLDLVCESSARLMGDVQQLNCDRVQQLASVPIGTSEQLNALAHAVGANRMSVVTALVGSVLKRYLSGEVMLGVTMSDVTHSDVENPELRIIPVPVTVNDGQTFQQLVADVSASFRLGAANTSTLSLKDLLHQVNRPTVFHALVKIGASRLAEGLDVANVQFVFDCTNDIVSVSSCYESGKYDKTSMQRLQAHVAMMAANTLRAAPEHLVSHISMMSASELQLLTQEWAHGAGVVDVEKPTLQQLLEVALCTAKSTQIAIENPQQRLKLTYQELDMVTMRLAQRLQTSHGIGPGSVVAVAAERTIETMVALLSVTRAGAAYLPVDLSYPSRRVQLMLSETKACVLLCHSNHSDEWRNTASSSCHVEEVDAMKLLATASTNTSVQPSFAEASRCDLAAVLYTSGSTGQPKGVEISHGALARQQKVMVENRGLVHTDRVVQETILTFDVAGNEIWGCLHARATLVMVDDDTRLLAFEAFLLRHKISVLFITPSHLSLINPAACGRSLRMLVVAGEALPATLVDKWSSLQRVIYNEYGPTETNVVTTRLCSKNMKNATSIGRPLPGVTLRILDKYLQPTAIGVAGELCVCGEQLAMGYLGSPEVTATKFVVEGMRMYKTGDLCRWLPDGSVDFAGRVDQQVKIRGMRVETSEIESSILSLASQCVSQCAVLLHGVDDSARLVAFLVLTPAGKLSWNEQDSRRNLHALLPQHMVPSAFEILEQMPITSSGKINRKQLMELGIRAAAELCPTRLDTRVDGKAAGTARLNVVEAASTMGSYLASDEVKALKRLGVDSLGIARRYFSLVQDAQNAAWELQVADGVRAICMYGVMLDHLASCMPGDVCGGFQRAITIPSSRKGLEPDSFAISAEILVRSVGNYKTIAGFVMTSGYMDAGTGPAALRFSMSDLIIYFIFLEMAWIFDPIATASAHAGGLDTYDPWWLSNHRWYLFLPPSFPVSLSFLSLFVLFSFSSLLLCLFFLFSFSFSLTRPLTQTHTHRYLLAMLLCRFAVVVMNGFRVPALAQLILAASALFLLPANMVCVSAGCDDGYIDWSAAVQPFNSLLYFFYTGTEPQRWDFPYAAFKYLLTRKYLLCVFLYVLAFHYGRPTARKALSMAAELRSSIDRFAFLPKSAKVFLPRFIYGIASASGLLAMSIYQSLYFEALEDNWVMEDGAHKSQATLPNLGLLVVYLVVQICLMAAMVSAMPNVLSWVGSSTLGSYVAHGYVNLVITATVLNNSSISFSIGGYLFLVLGVPALTQVFVGPLVQRALFFHLHFVARFVSKAAAMMCGDSDDRKDEYKNDTDNREGGQEPETRKDSLDSRLVFPASTITMG